MQTLSQFNAQFETYLLDFLSSRLQPQNLYQPGIELVQQGGKRLRPQLAFLGNLIGSSGSIQVQEECLGLGTALELFHNFTLMHDDLMDQSAIRRGAPTVYQRHGINQAILTGDVFCILAYQALGRCAEDLHREISNRFSIMAEDICRGQQMDTSTDGVNTHAEYLEMIRLKTAVLLGGSLEMGCMLGRENPEYVSLLFHYGEQIGIAFQIQDDWLDAFGQSQLVGKVQGNDLIQKKKNILYFTCLDSMSEGNQRTLQRFYEDENKPQPADIEDILQLMKENQIDQKIQNDYESIFAQANKSLEHIPVNHPGISELKKFVEHLKNRSN